MTGPYRGRNRAAEVACLADRENGLRATGRWGGGSSRRRCGSPHPTTRAEARRRGRRCHSPWRPRRRAALWPFAHARLAPTSRPGPMSWASPRRSWLSSARFLTGFVSARCFRRARDAACRNRMRGAPNSLLAPTNLPGCTRFLGLPPRRRSQIAAPRTRATRSPLPDRGYQVAAIRPRLSRSNAPGGVGGREGLRDRGDFDAQGVHLVPERHELRGRGGLEGVRVGLPVHPFGNGSPGGREYQRGDECRESTPTGNGDQRYQDFYAHVARCLLGLPPSGGDARSGPARAGLRVLILRQMYSRCFGGGGTSPTPVWCALTGSAAGPG